MRASAGAAIPDRCAVMRPLAAMVLLAAAWLLAGPAAGQEPADDAPARDTAVFAGGCFWCMEPPFDELDGVLATISGYAGGHVEDPTYEEVTAGGTGHREVVQVIYDPTRIGYPQLLDVFWRNVDPLDDGGQFCDRGFSYTTAVFAQDEEQLRQARASKEAVQDRFREEVVTPVVEDGPFYRAEEYHQDYYDENPIRYRFYRWSCGRDGRLEELWGQTTS
jgi:peptide-methionine (S)-S-oxide reductase